MPTAKSFQKLEQLCEPYEKNKRMYIRVRTTSGGEREVRWYTNSEYAKMYLEEEVEVSRLRSVKDVLGFEKGYITIFKGDIEAVEHWFRIEPRCRYHRLWGWYIISTDEIPTLPAEVSAVELPWSAVGLDDNTLKAEAVIIKEVENRIYVDSTSKYLGEVGQRLELAVVVKKAINIDNYFGSQTLHIFETPEGDVATWLTSARTLEVGKQYKLRGTIKSLDLYKGQKQTTLTRCTML